MEAAIGGSPHGGEEFEALADFSISNPGLVARGIKEALTTTAAGLVVAMAAQLFYSSLANCAERITDDTAAMASFLLEARETKS